MAQSVDIVVKARDQASKSFKKAGKSAVGFGSMLKKAAVAAGAFLGMRAIIRFTKQSISLYGEQEIAVQHLRDSLKLLGDTSEASLQSQLDFATEIQRATNLGDEAVIEQMSLLASMGNLTGDALRAGTLAAIGLSKAFKMDLKTSMLLVGKAATGQASALSRYGIVVDTTKTKTEQFRQVLELGAGKFALATGEVDTQKAAMERLSNTWGDFKEMIGEAISKHLPGFANSFKVAKVVIENWRLSMELVWVSVGLGIVSFVEDIKHFFVTVIPAWLVFFRDNWKEIFTDIWEGTKSIFANMWTNIKDFFTSVQGWLKGEGFDFKWTGLLDGFESVLGELPKIAQRGLSETESALQVRLEDLTRQMMEKIMEEFKGAAVDVKGILERAILPEIADAKGKKGGTRKGLAAAESRFLTFQPGARFDSTEKNTENTAKNTSQIVKIAKATNKKLVDIANAVKASGTGLAVSNFK